MLASEREDASHAYIFAGPPGVGKMAAALAFAASLICDEHGCGQCGECSRVLRGVHRDVAMYEPEGAVYTVDHVRQMVIDASRSASEGPRRVLIVAQADRAREHAQNAFLRALEEPGAPVVWLLISDSVEGLLPTVVSRCRLIRFNPMGQELAEQTVAASLGIDRQQARYTLALTAGNIGHALRWGGELAFKELAGLAARFIASPGTGAPSALNTAQQVFAHANLARDRLASTQGEQLHEYEQVFGQAEKGMQRSIAERHKRQLREREREVPYLFLAMLGVGLSEAARLGVDDSQYSPVLLDSADGIAGSTPSLSECVLAMDKVKEAMEALQEDANALLTLEACILEVQQVLTTVP